MLLVDDIPLAHGVGGAKDLPISTELMVAGAVAALTISFTVLAVAWRRPRYEEGAAPGRPAPVWLARLVDAAWFRVSLRVLGLLLVEYAALAAFAGKDVLINPVFGMFYVLWWVGIVPASLLLGPVWKAVSPFRSVAWLAGRLTGRDADEGFLRYPEQLGHWPAALGLYAFVWLELVYPHNAELAAVQVWGTTYVVLMAAGAVLFGGRFLEHADPFEVYSSLVARLSVWGRDGSGRLVVRSPLANLATLPARPGLTAVVAVLFGSTGFDSFSGSQRWVETTQRSAHPLVLDNLMLLVFVVVVGLVFAVATGLTPVPGVRRTAVPNRFAHSMVPIVVGYVFAHYFTYLVQVGQQTIALMSDPLSTGANLFGTADWPVNYWLSYHPTLLANLKVAGVVAGHLLGVVAAHDRAIAVLRRRDQLTGQLPLLVAMVAFTAGGLYLLFSA